MLLQLVKTIKTYALRPIPFFNAEIALHNSYSGIGLNHGFILFIIAAAQVHKPVYDQPDFLKQTFICHRFFSSLSFHKFRLNGPQMPLIVNFFN